MPRRNRRTSPTQRRGRRERQPNVFMGPVPEDIDPEDDDLLLDDSADEASESQSSPARGRRAERRRVAAARRGVGARNRAAVFSHNLPKELRKLGVMVAGTVVILGVLTAVLR
ncbi:MAG: hypothetical protein VB824_06850 [Dehalococcoidia bacterium]